MRRTEDRNSQLCINLQPQELLGRILDRAYLGQERPQGHTEGSRGTTGKKKGLKESKAARVTQSTQEDNWKSRLSPKLPALRARPAQRSGFLSLRLKVP